MESKKIVTGVIMAAVVVILLATLLIPVINDYQTSTTITKVNSVNNSNLVKYTDDLDDLDVTLTWKNGDTYISNGTDQIGIGAYNSAMIVSDKGMVGISKDGTDKYGKITSSTDVSNPSALTSAVDTITINIDDDDVTITVTYSDETATLTKNWTGLTWVAYADLNGNYKMQQNSTPKDVYINPTQHVFGVAWISTNSTGFWAFNNGSSNVGAMTWTKSKVSGFDDLYTYNTGTGYHLDRSVLVNADDSSITPYFEWIPVNVECHTEVDTQYIGLFNVLPILIILALLVSIVSIVVRGRN